MGRESGTAETDDSAGLYPVEYEAGILRNIGHKRVGEVYALRPFVTLDGNLDMRHPVARKILAGRYRLHRTADGRMYER